MLRIVALCCSPSGNVETAFMLNVYFSVVFVNWCEASFHNACLYFHVAQADILLLVCRHLAALKQRELENARVTAEEMEKQMAPLR